MKKVDRNALELLAPVGSLESFFAAVENGADAVFCGLQQFSARAKAKNFTLEELERIKGYAAMRGVKVYVALNTLIKERELKPLVELLAELEYLGVDGLIIQDLGLYQLARSFFPTLPLHASTQMLIHNLAGVLMLEAMGFRRVVLARELSLKEIGAIHRQSNLELEHFVHGALCYSMSGHCLFSSYIDGRSGNRGRCIQPCRRRYHHNGEAGFHFSTSDFSAIEMIPDLVKAGVTSFKIEGRMKSAEYVATVVAGYRMVIDAKPGNEKDALRGAREKLTNAMGRSSSHGFLHGVTNKDLVLTKQKGGIGKVIGKVAKIYGKSIAFKTEDVLYVGDRLRIQPSSDRAGQGFTVRTLTINKKSVKRAGTGSFVSIPLPFQGKVSGGDLVFKLATGKSFTLSEEACRRRLSSAPLQSTAVHLTIVCKTDLLSVVASVAGMEIKKEYSAPMVAARRSPLTEKTLRKVFTSTGNPLLSLASLRAENLPPVVIKPSRLKEIRRDFYHVVFAEVEPLLQEQRVEKLAKITTHLARTAADFAEKQSSQLFVATDQMQDVAAVADYPEIRFIFPVNSQLYNEVILKERINPELRKQVVWDLDSIVFDDHWQGLVEKIDSVVQAGFSSFRVNNLSQLQLFAHHSAAHLMAGQWLYTLNSQMMEATAGYRIQQWFLSLEDDRDNIQALLAGREKHNLLCPVYSPVDLFTSRIQPSIPEQNFILHNDKGGVVSLLQNNGLTVTRAERDFSLIGRLQTLRRLGCSNFVLDLRGRGLFSEEGQDILQAYFEDRTIAGTTTFNFERGLR